MGAVAPQANSKRINMGKWGRQRARSTSNSKCSIVALTIILAQGRQTKDYEIKFQR